jgi:WD40 repeat protein
VEAISRLFSNLEYSEDANEETVHNQEILAGVHSTFLVSATVAEAGDRKAIFAYLAQSENETAVSFVNREGNLVQSEPEIPSKGAVVNSNGWVALVSTVDTSLDLLALTNIANKKVHRPFIKGRVRIPYNNETLAWSHDGHYVAFVVQNDLHIYATLEKSLKIAPNAIDGFYSMAWSNQLPRLLLATGSCTDGCNHRIEIYDPQTLEITSRLSLSHVMLGAAAQVLCQPLWSPDDVYLAMVSVCYGADTFAPRELYIWNTQTDQFERLTSYTVNKDYVPFASYKHFWLDAQTLLVSVVYFAPDGIKTETFSYTVQTQKTLRLSDASFQELAINPVSGMWAVRAVANFETLSTPTNTQLLLGDMTQGLRPAAGMITADQIACNLHWSPDGEVLASTLHRTQCSAPVEAIVFYDRTGQVISRHVPAGDPTQRQIIPIGWLAR